MPEVFFFIAKLEILYLGVAVGHIPAVHLPGETGGSSFPGRSDIFEGAFVLRLGDSEDLFRASALSVECEDKDDRILADVLELQIPDRRIDGRIESWILDGDAVDLRFIEIPIIDGMRFVFYPLESEIGERSLEQRSSDAAEPAAVDQLGDASERGVSGHIHIFALARIVMHLLERAEDFAWHDDPDVADIVECRHDVPSPVIAVRIDPGFP